MKLLIPIALSISFAIQSNDAKAAVEQLDCSPSKSWLKRLDKNKGKLSKVKIETQNDGTIFISTYDTFLPKTFGFRTMLDYSYLTATIDLRLRSVSYKFIKDHLYVGLGDFRVPSLNGKLVSLNIDSKKYELINSSNETEDTICQQLPTGFQQCSGTSVSVFNLSRETLDVLASLPDHTLVQGTFVRSDGIVPECPLVFSSIEFSLFRTAVDMVLRGEWKPE